MIGGGTQHNFDKRRTGHWEVIINLSSSSSRKAVSVIFCLLDVRVRARLRYRSGGIRLIK